MGVNPVLHDVVGSAFFVVGSVGFVVGAVLDERLSVDTAQYMLLVSALFFMVGCVLMIFCLEMTIALAVSLFPEELISSTAVSDESADVLVDSSLDDTYGSCATPSTPLTTSTRSSLSINANPRQFSRYRHARVGLQLFTASCVGFILQPVLYLLRLPVSGHLVGLVSILGFDAGCVYFVRSGRLAYRKPWYSGHNHYLWGSFLFLLGCLLYTVATSCALSAEWLRPCSQPVFRVSSIAGAVLFVLGSCLFLTHSLHTLFRTPQQSPAIDVRVRWPTSKNGYSWLQRRSTKLRHERTSSVIQLAPSWRLSDSLEREHDDEL